MIFTDAVVRTSPRTLIVVRRRDEATYHFLKARLAGVRGVEVTLDRRGGDALTPANDRRRAGSRFNAFGIQVIRR